MEESIQTLMGKDVEPRFRFIVERAPKVEDVDVRSGARVVLRGSLPHHPRAARSL